MLSDINMPQMTGLRLMEESKKSKPSVPVILITAQADMETAIAAVKWGAFNYLEKPFSMQKIYEVVTAALSASKK